MVFERRGEIMKKFLKVLEIVTVVLVIANIILDIVIDKAKPPKLT